MAFAGSDAFTTQGTAVDDNLMVADVGVSVKLSRSTSLDLGYQGQYGSDTQVNAVNANIRWSF
jgi:outer membrane autotransporter protein